MNMLRRAKEASVATSAGGLATENDNKEMSESNELV